MPIGIANAPCSWGTLEFEGLEGESIPYAQMLDELVETGYRGTELGDLGYMPTVAAELSAELARRGLALVGGFVPARLRRAASHDAGVERALRVARLMADAATIGAQEVAPFLVLADDNGTDEVRTRHAGRVTSAMRLPESDRGTFARGAERIARAVLDETGLRTVFHHHSAGYIETPDEIAWLLGETDPERLGLVFDTGHFLYGCGANDPGAVVGFLERHAERIWYVHFKDCHPEVASTARRQDWDYFEAVRRGVFCELGHGCVDFPALVGWLRERRYDGWVVVEQDVLPGMGSPKESARRSREYLRSLGL